jgi:protein-tyrosine phosphatase
MVLTLLAGRVLVNCQMGMSRSSTCVLAYLMLRQNMTAVEALTEVNNWNYLTEVR